MLHCTSLEKTNTLFNCVTLLVTKKIKCCEYNLKDCIHNISFSLWHKNGSSKLQCYITIGLKNLPKTNTLAYYALLKVAKKMKCCECNLKDSFHNISFSLWHKNGPSKLQCYITIVWKGLPKINALAYCAWL